MLELANLDPNVVYLALMISLWVGITTAYIPGTGVVEVIAGVGLIGTLIVLADMPVNWISVLLIVIGCAGFILVPFIDERFTIYALSGLVLQMIGALMLFESGPGVSPLVIALTIVLPLAYYQWVLIPMLRRNRELTLAAREDSVVGMLGYVTQTIDPLGTVTVDSELWTATSEEVLNPGEQVIVVDRQGLRLMVEKHKAKRANGLAQEEITL